LYLYVRDSTAEEGNSNGLDIVKVMNLNKFEVCRLLFIKKLTRKSYEFYIICTFIAK